MADSKISALTSATAVGTHEIPVNAGGGLTRKVTVSSILSLASGSPGGADTQVQFNDGGVFGGDSGLVFNKTTNTLTVGNFVKIADAGSASAPVLVINSGGGAIPGWYDVGGWAYADGSGNTQLRLIGGGSPQIRLRSTWGVAWSSGDPAAAGEDLVICRDAANVLAQRNGTNAQAFRVYNTYTDASNYERMAMGWNGNTWEFETQAAGTGAARNWRFLRNTGLLMTFDGGGVTISSLLTTITHFPAADASYDSGAGALRWRDLFLGGSLKLGAADTFLTSDAANILAQRNGTNAQAFRVYNTWTDASNYERGIVGWVANVLTIGTNNAGSGNNRDVEIIRGAGNPIATFGSSNVFFHVSASSDGDMVRDLGSSGIRWKNLFLGQYLEGTEMTAPAAPAANQGRVFFQDNGSGKTQLMVIFSSGAAQQVAIQP